MTVNEQLSIAEPEARQGAERSPLRLAAGVVGLLVLALWAFFELDTTAVKDAERRERWSLQALNVRIAALDEQCRSAGAAGPGGPGESSLRGGACAELEDARKQLPAAEAAYRRACSRCAEHSRCEEALDDIRTSSVRSIVLGNCR